MAILGPSCVVSSRHRVVTPMGPGHKRVHLFWGRLPPFASQACHFPDLNDIGRRPSLRLFSGRLPRNCLPASPHHWIIPSSDATCCWHHAISHSTSGRPFHRPIVTFPDAIRIKCDFSASHTYVSFFACVPVHVSCSRALHTIRPRPPSSPLH